MLRGLTTVAVGGFGTATSSVFFPVVFSGFFEPSLGLVFDFLRRVQISSSLSLSSSDVAESAARRRLFDVGFALIAQHVDTSFLIAYANSSSSNLPAFCRASIFLQKI